MENSPKEVLGLKVTRKKETLDININILLHEFDWGEYLENQEEKLACQQ